MWNFLLGAVGPLAIRALTLIGFTAVTFTGVTALTDSLVSQAQTSWAGLPADVLALAAIAGLPQALGLVFGAMVARTALWVGSSASRLLLRP